MKILVLRRRNVCYDSYIYFSDMAAKSLSGLGCDVTTFTYEAGSYDALESLCGNSYDVILDFNSMLPRMILDDDTRLLSHIGGVFFDFILDHPLYHHDSLCIPIEGFNVICLDKNHKAYIEKMYPHIDSVTVIGTTGSASEDFDDSRARDIDILFTGTYTSPDDVMESIGNTPPFMRDYTYKLIDRMTADPALPVEEAVDFLIETEGNEVMREMWALHTQAFFLVDTYLRAKVRDDVIRAVSGAGLPLTVCGNGWENMPGLKADILQEVDFDETFALMARSKIVLNVMPCFKAGVHDRVYSAMLNKALCVTDPSSMLKEQFDDEKDIVFYQIDNLTGAGGLIEKLDMYLADEPRRLAIALAGYKTAANGHSWERRAADMLRVMQAALDDASSCSFF